MNRTPTLLVLLLLLASLTGGCAANLALECTTAHSLAQQEACRTSMGQAN